MKSREAADLGRFAGIELRHATTLVHGVHSGISDTIHRAVQAAVGPAALPVQIIADAVTSTAYTATGFGLDAGSRVAGWIAGQRLRSRGDEAPSIHDAPRGHQALAFGLGIRGDAIHAHTPSISPAMQVRSGGRRVDLTPEGVGAAYGQIGDQIAVFLHGLCGTEAAWQWRGNPQTPYAARLATDLGLTPVTVRYNTGLRISENGQALVALLDSLHSVWPVPLTKIVLIGHSMGGLVVHSALAQAPDDAAWLPLVTDSVSLGAPHHGSPVARGVRHAADTLTETTRGRRIGAYLAQRSLGVRDLEYGNVVPADWQDAGSTDTSDRRTHPPDRTGIRHHAIVAVLGRRPAQLGAGVGDLLVPLDSARHLATATHPSRFADEDVTVVTGLDHLGLLNNDRVYTALHAALSAPELSVRP